MYKEKKICVIIPALNEELLLPRTLDSMPDWVDSIVVIDDASTDKMPELLEARQKNDSRIQVITHSSNLGLGQSLIDGYQFFKSKTDTDICAVMAGDNQMSPKDLPQILNPLIKGSVDYVKGNRLLRSEAIKRMPFYRYIGNSILSLLTKIATGYWKLIDPQCGYTAISRNAIEIIPIQNMVKGYGYNAHILNMLNLNNFKVTDVEVEPVYGDEKSKIKVIRYTFNVSILLLKLTFKRLIIKYLVRDFHPLFLLYLFGLIQILISIFLLIRFISIFAATGLLPQTTLLLLYFSSSIGALSLFLGMWLDMEDRRRR